MTDAVAAPPLIADAILPVWAPQLIALDLDGTCVDDDLVLQPRLAAAVAAAARRVPVVIATGRMYRSTVPWGARLGVTTPIVCYQGAVVRHQPDANGAAGTTIFECGLDGVAARRVVAVAREHGWHRQAYRNDRVLCEEDRREAHEYGDIAQVAIDYVDDLDAAVVDGSTKMVVVIDTEAGAQACEAALREALGTTARVVRSRPEFVEVTNVAAMKSTGLAHLCAVLDVDIARAVAVGDAPNDTDMLAAVGFGVAIEGARPDVLAAAAARCGPPGVSGVADVLEAFGLT